MASGLDLVWGGGASLGGAVEENPSEAGTSTRSTTRSKPKAAPRTKKGKVVTLSSSFTCWRLTPDPWLNCYIKNKMQESNLLAKPLYLTWAGSILLRTVSRE